MKKTVSVAPMMDCTDKHEIFFLSLISKNIHLFTEMIVANAIIRGDRDKLLSFKKISNPVTLQIGGSNPDELAEACKISEDYGYSEVNLNFALGNISRRTSATQGRAFEESIHILLSANLISF